MLPTCYVEVPAELDEDMPKVPEDVMKQYSKQNEMKAREGEDECEA